MSEHPAGGSGPLGSNGGDGAPLPSEGDYGVDQPPADEAPGFPAGMDMGRPDEPAVGDDDGDVDSIYGHTQAVHEPTQPVPQTAATAAGEGAPIRATPLGIIDPQLIPQRRWLLGLRHLRDQITATIGAGPVILLTTSTPSFLHFS